eukprot:TRINITY_DN2628_c0_g1_i1.p1 TRINITY_DN2628_c0_g1~~TRINITY_DN2628_c0_g1_i1.p1  ORF type:complete len:413 (+),score=81.58 TRINITY_DN2628_c0_g1_i1:286-1524(+)
MTLPRSCPNAESSKGVIKKHQVWEDLWINLQKSKEEGKVIIFSLSPQSRCSLSSYFNLSQETFYKKLKGVLEEWGVRHLIDVSIAREMALLESTKEFINRMKANPTGGPLPLLSGSCPGWISYAESMHGDYVLPYISTVKSPQQIMGTLVKKYYSQQWGLAGSHIFHVTVMPCIDKRLEAGRSQFFDEELKMKDVDFVLTSKDLLELLQKQNVNLDQKPEATMDTLLNNIENEKFYGVGGGPSDGYLEHIFKTSAKELFGETIDNIQYTIIGKTSDFKETSLIVNGNTVLKFAAVYGFRNIHTLVKQIKSNTCPYHYIELMACPSGCTNGGGQIDSDFSGKNTIEVLEQVNKLFQSQPVRPPGGSKVQEIYHSWLPDKTSEFLHTSYQKTNFEKPTTKSSCKCASSNTALIW